MLASHTGFFSKMTLVLEWMMPNEILFDPRFSLLSPTCSAEVRGQRSEFVYKPVGPCYLSCAGLEL